MDFLSGLFTTGAKILGGLFGQSAGAKDAQAAQQQAFQNTEIAQQDAIPNLVAGAKAAGINPLAALGVSSPGFSAVVNPNSGDFGKSIADSGQDLGRSALAAFGKEDKTKVLEEELLKAKIANVNADTVHQQAVTSGLTRSIGAPGTGPGVPLPTPDPRGPVIQLMQRALDWRTGEIVDIPSEKAASPLQTLAASPTNAALAGYGMYRGLTNFDNSIVPPGSTLRSLNPGQTPDIGWGPYP